MNDIREHLIKIVFLFVILWGFVSCDSSIHENVITLDDEEVNVGFRIVTRAAEGEYEAGQTYENYIDVVGESYRFYFFDQENKLIARFRPTEVLATAGSDYTEYSVLGMAPAVLAKVDKFKVVVIANWPTYIEDSEMVRGKTTIEDLCNHEKSQFEQFESFALNSSQLIPFFGVREYENVSFMPNVATMLTEPITLLRAVAKVEVILKSEQEHHLTFDTLQVCRYNQRGYCLPNADSHDDYDHNGQWDEDYAESLHLVNGKNDVNENNEPEEKSLPLLHVDTWVEGDSKYEKWIAYLTEYQNRGTGDGYCFIEAKLKSQFAGDMPYKIYFANYVNGQADNTDANRLNVERNNIYRFNVVVTPLQLLVSVDKWVYGGTVHIDM